MRYHQSWDEFDAALKLLQIPHSLKRDGKKAIIHVQPEHEEAIKSLLDGFKIRRYKLTPDPWSPNTRRFVFERSYFGYI
jgi:hypothetical protein